jgi:DNA-binding transcriptional ArsR family regulator
VWIEHSRNPSNHGAVVIPHSSFGGSNQPLYEIKANLFKALAHPARIRILEILCASDIPTPVSEILAETGLEPSLLSQHLAVLKRHQVVSAERTGNAVHYQVSHPKVAELLRIARAFLADTLAASHEQLGALDSLPPLDPTR